jgi:GTP-binding protein
LSHPAPGQANPLQSRPIEFVGSFPDPLVKLEPPLPEIAFVGRSNVGKSSLLNALVDRPGLARVSGTPGKTTLLNFYRLPELYLVDLPGYGFARASKSARTGYQRLMNGYLRGRSTLAGIVWLLDIRHPPSVDDRAMQEVLVEGETHVLAALTKGDKLSVAQRQTRARELRDDLELPEDQVVVTSAKSGEGMVELREAIAGLIGKTA